MLVSPLLLSSAVFVCCHPNERSRFPVSGLCLQLSTPLFSFQRFNEVTEAEITLQNSGKVGFTYAVLSPSAATADSPLPGVPLVIPSTVSPGVAQVINPDRVSGCPREGYRENKGKKTKEKKKEKNPQKQTGETGL